MKLIEEIGNLAYYCVGMALMPIARLVTSLLLYLEKKNWAEAGFTTRSKEILSWLNSEQQILSVINKIPTNGGVRAKLARRALKSLFREIDGYLGWFIEHYLDK